MLNSRKCLLRESSNSLTRKFTIHSQRNEVHSQYSFEPFQFNDKLWKTNYIPLFFISYQWGGHYLADDVYIQEFRETGVQCQSLNEELSEKSRQRKTVSHETKKKAHLGEFFQGNRKSQHFPCRLCCMKWARQSYHWYDYTHGGDAWNVHHPLLKLPDHSQFFFVAGHDWNWAVLVLQYVHTWHTPQRPEICSGLWVGITQFAKHHNNNNNKSSPEAL